MPTIAEAVYAETIKSLPSAEQLEIASLILQTLTEAKVLQAKETISYITLVPRKTTDVHLRSPHFANPADALRFQKYEVTEPETAADAGV